jgi:arginyl-tRNA--protein-N-Asp/Glu arginylyltransferase
MRLPLEDTFISWSIPPGQMDDLWAAGWWYLGPVFFRRAYIEWGGRLAPLQHLRLRLNHFRPSDSQRRTLRRNADLEVRVRPAQIDDERRELFNRHKIRFSDSIPRDLEDFLGPSPSTNPVPAMEFGVYLQDRLVAASYLARGVNSVASLYCIFDPEESRRGLGIFTMLSEIQWAKEQGCKLYYPGYALLEPSPMDYKKTFYGLQMYEWGGKWHAFARQPKVAKRPAVG